MNFIMRPPIKPHSFCKKGQEKNGANGASNREVAESLIFIQSKQKRFLDLLAAQRADKSNAIDQFHSIDLSHADLRDVDLTGIDLTGANLTNANLSGAKLIGTNLTKAKLIRTILCNTDLANAILTDAVVDRTTQLSLQQASNQQWYKAAQNSIEGFNQKWEKLKSKDGFNTFESALKRVLKNNFTAAEIVEVIESVITSPDICRLIFLATHGVNVHCHSQLLIIFNTVQILARFDKLMKKNVPRQEILTLAKSWVRQNLLDEATLPIMRHQWSEGRRACNGEGTGPDIEEAVNVQLALRHQLAAQLNLLFPIKDKMSAMNSAGVTHSDKEFALDFIRRYMDDKEQLISSLISLPIWQLYLERRLGKKINQKALDKAEQLAIEALLWQETEKMLSVE